MSSKPHERSLAVSLMGRLLVATLFAAAQGACLPADTRPPPGTLIVNVTADDSLSPEHEPFLTDDGWSITFERFLLGIGNTGFAEDDACNDYQGFGSQYGRLLDMQAGKTQRLSEMRFLGSCELGFEITTPEGMDVLGEHVTEVERHAMRAPSDDAYTTGRGTSLRAVGSARKGDHVKHFDWSFRQGVMFEQCRSEGETGIELSGEESKTIDLVVGGSVLFQEALDSTDLRFDAFAEADDLHGDADGNVTFEEMAAVTLNPEASGQGGSSGDHEIETLADLVYVGLFPRVARYPGDGTCDVHQIFHVEPDDGPDD
jgi:hypothetical protein